MNRKSGINNSKNKLLYDPNQRMERRLGAFSIEEETEEVKSVEEENLEEEFDTEEVNEEEVGQDNVIYQNEVDEKEDVKESINSKKVMEIIKKHPWILGVIGAIFFFFLMVVIFLGVMSNMDGHYAEECDFNNTTVYLTVCNTTDPIQISLKDYVMGVTYAMTKDKDLSKDVIKAIMIVNKTNALGNGNYDNSVKNLVLDTCQYEFVGLYESNEDYDDYNKLYTSIENYIYISKSYNTTIYNLSSLNALQINDKIIDKMSEIDGNYLSILNSLYDVNSGSDDSEPVKFVDNMFIGDSNVKNMIDFGLVSDKKAVYGPNIDWLNGNLVGDADTNAKDGGINNISKKFKENTGYNIVIWLGSEDTSNDASVYYNRYYQLASEWNDKNIYIVSLVEGLDNKEYVNKFNANMSDYIRNSGLSNLYFISLDNVVTLNESGYSKIYSSIMKNLSQTQNLSSKYQLYDLNDHCEFILEEKKSKNYNDACESMSISETRLSKAEFKERLTNYFNPGSDGYTFVNNADQIYDIATKNGINPELVVVRAFAEGFSPASKGYSSYNNYWGMRCYNGKDLSTCANYATFSEGVLAFVENVSQYDSLNSMMNKYAYIGSVWQNPGGAGAGGCYYFSYIEKYLSPERRRVVADACNVSKPCSGSGCLATTDEDQEAYSKWQVANMASIRNRMFNLEDDECGFSSGSCTIYSQSDERWANVPLGKSQTNMTKAGCAVTSIAIGISCSGVATTVDNFDAGKFINKLNESSCFDAGGSIYWQCSGINEIAPGVAYMEQAYLTKMSNEEKIAKIKSYDPNNTFLVIHVNKNTRSGHWVVYSSISGEKVVVKDPGNGKINNYDLKSIDRLVVYSTNGGN